MPKKCIPGIICLETFNFFILIMLLLLFFYLFHVQSQIAMNSVSSQNDILPLNSSSNAIVEKKPMSNIINIPTQAMNHTFSQIGILTSTNTTPNGNIILPIMGKQLITSRNNWQYYTMSDQNNSIKIPLSFNGKSCMDEYGCEEILDGDNVYAEGYNDIFKVTLYERNNYAYNTAL